MSKTRTATLAVLGGALTASLVTGTAGTASAKHVWCEESVPYACSGWSGAAQQPAGMGTTELRKLETLRTL